jgi:co-chaperonin GroES (HSP10)
MAVKPLGDRVLVQRWREKEEVREVYYPDTAKRKTSGSVQ